jgi:pimeloyl-ACP methyl ester carboxylesterase
MANRQHVAYRHSTNVRSNKGREWAIRQIFKALSSGSPRLTGWLVEKLFFTPGSYVPSAEERRRLEQGRPFHVRVHGRRICGWRWGAGPGVLLIHGWSGRGIQLHRYIDPLVRAGRTAIAIDGPAHGESEGRSTSYFEFTDVVRTLIDPDLGFGIEGIVAHSFGAAAVVNALAHQKAALRTVLLAPPFHLGKTLFDALERHGIPPRVYEKIISAYETRFGYSLNRDDPHRRLGDLRSPVLVVHDRHDPVIAYVDSEALCGRFGQVTLKTTSGLGHRRIMTDPDVVEAGVSHLVQDRTEARAPARPGDLEPQCQDPLSGDGRRRHAAR